MVRQNVFYKITRHIKKKKKNVLAATNKWISFLISIYVVFGCFAVIYMLLSMRRNPCGFLLLVRCYRMAVYVFWLVSVYCNNKSLIDPLNSTFIVLKIQLYKKRRDVKKYLNLKQKKTSFGRPIRATRTFDKYGNHYTHLWVFQVVPGPSTTGIAGVRLELALDNNASHQNNPTRFPR